MKQIIDAAELNRLIDRLAADIASRNKKETGLALVGIKRRGVPLANRLAERLVKKRAGEIPVGAIDITLYRDDLQLVAETPIVRGTEIDFDINGRTILLVDDVIYTGRTTRAALASLLDFGRPKAIRLVVLIDRGHRELPIQPDFTGKTIETKRGDLVDICLEEEDGMDGVFLTLRK